MFPSVYYLGKDIKCFVRKNAGKLVLFGIIFVLCLVFAVRAVFLLASVSDYIENASGALYSYVIGNGSLLTLILVSLLEALMLVFLIYACAYNDLTVLVSILGFIYKSYTGIYKSTLVLMYHGAKAIPFFLLYTVTLLAFVGVYAANIIAVLNSHLRWKYGKAEFRCLLMQTSPFFLVYAVLFVLTMALVCIGSIFF